VDPGIVHLDGVVQDTLVIERRLVDAPDQHVAPRNWRSEQVWRESKPALMEKDVSSTRDVVARHVKPPRLDDLEERRSVGWTCAGSRNSSVAIHSSSVSQVVYPLYRTGQARGAA
jgi:hypothetical protein